MLYNVVLVSAIRQHESAARIHTSPSPGTSLPPPSASHPSSCLRPQGSGSLHHTENPPWLSISHTIMHMFPCCSLSSSHSLPPPLCPQVCFLCLHLHCYPANGFISTFLDSIYMYQYINIYINIYMCQYFSFSPLCIMDCSFIHLIRTDSNVFFYG